MENKFTYLILIFLCFFISINVTAQDDLLRPFAEQNIPEIWKPAPSTQGSIDWSILTDIDVRQEEINNFVQYVPTFTPVLKSLDNSSVKLNGYLLPLDAGEFQSHFILMAYPHACPFHMPGGPGGFVEVITDIPVKFTYDPILIEGHFELLQDFSMGMFYRITAASAVNNQ
ncbi:DUF3299 domain-containing protein [Kordiimonas laminariae]|uniref:DUF3299 domain-containing protein n=1 Tax=Kordiimonas laminariae TaxID=2917717 RepID=UPI001FF6E5BF|nr:DUF3299 domain-containing protein [Kordiimonas laminariae]MCK0070621.1 DUF3299 domain-containing protein [Kordiimonas laminariae]